jgi:hypothetical protein
MQQQPPLHSAVVSRLSPAAGIASNHPAMGQCQLARLRELGVPEHQIDTVVDIARHIRDEAAAHLDHAFKEAACEALGAAVTKTAANAADEARAPKTTSFPVAVAIAGTANESGCCSTTNNGQSCC